MHQGPRLGVVILLMAPLIGGCVGESDPDRPVESQPPASAPSSNIPGPGSPEPTSPATPPSPPSQPRPLDLGDFRLEWSLPADAYHRQYSEAFQRAKTFENTTALLNFVLSLPRDLPVAHRECSEANAFYDPAQQRITLCYEMLGLIAQLFAELQSDAESYAAAVTSAWLFIFFHEMGHGLIDLYDLPVTGREEDAVDDLATLVLIDVGAPESALMAAFFWAGLDDGDYSTIDFADEHSLDPQRFFTIMCTVYGSAPQNFSWLVQEGHLPTTRAERCPSEYQQKDQAWSRLLEPWVKDDTVNPEGVGTIDPPIPFPSPRPPPPPPPPETTYLANSKPIAVPAETVFHHTVILEKASSVGFAFAVVDTSSLDVGIVRNSDLARFEAGESVPIWAYQEDVQSAQGTVVLDSGAYDLVFYCLNTFFDCDLEYSLAVTA